MVAVAIKKEKGRRIVRIRLNGSRLGVDEAIRGLKMRHRWVKSDSIGAVNGRRVIWIDVTASRLNDEIIVSRLQASMEQLEKLVPAMRNASAGRPLSLVSSQTASPAPPPGSNLPRLIAELRQEAADLGVGVLVTFQFPADAIG